MSFQTESVVPIEFVEIIQYRRRHSLNEDAKNLESIKEYGEMEEIRLNDSANKASFSPSTCTPGGGVGIGIDGGYGWVIVLCSFLLNFIVDGITLTEGLLEAPILKATNNTESEFGVSEFSWVNGCLTGVTLLVGPLASVMVDKFGFRVTVITGGIIAASGILLSWALSPHIPNINHLIIFYGIVGGIGFGLIFSPSVVIVSHYFDKRRALATGMAICGTGMGTLAMAPLGVYLIESLNWNGTIPIQAGIVLLCIVIGSFLVQPPTLSPLKKIFGRTSNNQTNSIPSPNNNSSNKMKNSEKNLKQFLPFFLSPTYMILAVSGGITMLGFFSPFAYIPGRAKLVTNNEFLQGFLLSIVGIFNVIARIIFGFLSDRPGTNNLIMSNAALTIGGITTMFSYQIESYWLLACYCAVFGISIGCFATLRSILILEFIGLEKLNDGFGLSLMFMGVTSLFSSPIAGFLIDFHNGSYVVPFIVAGSFMTISGVLCYPLRYVDKWEKSWKHVQ